MTQGKRGWGVSSYCIGWGMTVRLGQKAFALGVVPLSCLQVCDTTPLGWCWWHRVCLGLNDEGIKDESNNVPHPCVLLFAW